jgi:hypothetical protein
MIQSYYDGLRYNLLSNLSRKTKTNTPSRAEVPLKSGKLPELENFCHVVFNNQNDQDDGENSKPLEEWCPYCEPGNESKYHQLRNNCCYLF